MPRYVAFLRAINVGGHVVEMARLRRLFEDFGFTGVESFIASGNVIFASPSRSGKALEAKIARGLHEALGYEVRAFVRTVPELDAIARFEPFPGVERHALYVAFVADPPGAGVVRTLRDGASAVDEFHVRGREVWWLCREPYTESAYAGTRFEKTLGVPTTVRNVTTIRKLAAKVAPERKSA